MKPISDKAEVSIDFPEKAYMGSFGRNSAFEVQAKDDEMLLKLRHAHGERREVAMHLHYYLLADILGDLAEGLETLPPLDEPHRAELARATEALAAALKKTAGKT